MKVPEDFQEILNNSLKEKKKNIKNWRCIFCLYKNCFNYWKRKKLKQKCQKYDDKNYVVKFDWAKKSMTGN